VVFFVLKMQLRYISHTHKLCRIIPQPILYEIPYSNHNLHNQMQPAT
jgi:hypothetical protein